jgi:hypothetical protein
LGLSLATPDAQPAILVADFKDADHPDSVRFRLQVSDEKGQRSRRFTSRELPTLSLIPAQARVLGAPGTVRQR